MGKVSDVVLARLRNQRLSGERFRSAGEAVRWFGAVQGQDFLASMWGLGQRIHDSTEDEIERTVDERKIIRTWSQRGTIHYVPAEDGRWMLDLMTPRIISGAAKRYRDLGLDDAAFERAKEEIHTALHGGKVITRPNLMRHLESKGISTAGQRGYHILYHLAQKGFLCLGPREGKQPTVVLLDEIVSENRNLSHDEALAEIATRYFQSRGPATLHDFVWWTGLTVADCRAAMDYISSSLEEWKDGDRTIWHIPNDLPEVETERAMMLPFVDEYTVGYADRRDFLKPEYADKTFKGLMATVLIDGGIVGMWSRKLLTHRVIVMLDLFRKLDQDETTSLEETLRRYGDFLDKEIEARFETVKPRS